MQNKINTHKNKTTVALVANTSWSIYNFRLNLIKSLQKHGYEVVVIAPKDNFSAALISAGVSYYPIYMDNYGTNPISEIQIIKQLHRIYKAQPIDFIFHYTIKPNIYGSIAAKMAGIPSISITTGLGHLLSFSNSIVRMMSFFLYKIGVTFSKEIWFLNQIDQNDFIKYKIAPESKTFLLPSEGIDTEYFKPTDKKENGSSMRLLFAGRIIWYKGFKEFIDAAKVIKKKYPYVEFQVVGFVDPSNPNAVPFDYILENQESGLIKYYGETSDIRPFLQNCHFLFFPSFYREWVSRVLLEAASMKTPIITTNNVGCDILVDDSITGYLVEKKDSNALIQAIEKFINLPYHSRLEMGELARLKIMELHQQSKINSIYLEKLEKWIPQKNIKTKETTSQIKEII